MTQSARNSSSRFNPNTSKTTLLSPELRREIEAVGFLKHIEDKQKGVKHKENEHDFGGANIGYLAGRVRPDGGEVMSFFPAPKDHNQKKYFKD
jgi:hypothetical protein